jgi:hypothetical protein
VLNSNQNLKEKEMSARLNVNKVWLLATITAPMIAGCAPGPAPPLPPALLGQGAIWLIAGLLVWIGIILWKNLKPGQPDEKDHIIEALNSINERLTALEAKIEQLEKNNCPNHSRTAGENRLFTETGGNSP